MGVWWWWGWEMRWHMGGSSTCLLSTWQELEVRSCHSSSAHPPSLCATPSSSTALGRGWYLSWQNPLLVADCFSPSSAGILHGEVGQQDLPEPSAQWVMHALGSQSCGGQIEQRIRFGYQLLPGMDSSRNPGQTQKAGDWHRAKVHEWHLNKGVEAAAGKGLQGDQSHQWVWEDKDNQGLPSSCWM